MDSAAYIRLIQGGINNYGGMNKICAVVSDSAQCFVKAKDAILRESLKIVSIPDHAHFADLLILISLMRDVGGMP